MTLKELEARMVAVEKTVETLQSKLDDRNGTAVSPHELDPAKQIHWWNEIAGKYKDDPDFLEAMRLGREYRDSQNPYKRKKKKKTKK